MVQDRLPAFWNGDVLVSVDQFRISEVDVPSFLDEQCGVILCLVLGPVLLVFLYKSCRLIVILGFLVYFALILEVQTLTHMFACISC